MIAKFGSSYSACKKSTFIQHFVGDIFVILENYYFTSYADDTTPYGVDSNAEEVFFELKEFLQKPFTWFYENLMKTNHERCYLL